MSCPYSLQNLNQENENTATPQNQSNNKSSSSTSTSTTTSPNSPSLTPAQALQLAKSSCPAFSSSCPFVGVHDAEGMRKALSSLPPSHLKPSSVDFSSSSSSSQTVSTSATASVTTSANSSTEGDGDHVIDTTSNGMINNTNDGTIIDSTNNVSNTNTQAPHVEISESLRVALQHVHVISQTLHSSPQTSTRTLSPMTTTTTTTTNTTTPNISNNDEPNSTSQKYEIEGGCPFKTLYIQKNPSLNSSSLTYSFTFIDAMESFSINAIIANMLEQVEQQRDQSQDQSQMSADLTVPTIPSSLSSSVLPTKPPQNEQQQQRQQQQQQQQQHMTKKRPSLKKSISTALKTGTQVSHEAAESVHFVKEFIQGNIDSTLYTQLIYNLYHVYDTLEDCLDQHAPTHFPSLHFPEELGRKESLIDDVEFFMGMDWDVNPTTQPFSATVQYQERLQWISKTEPLLLLSHAYTRYLGDLSGGKVLARVARKALQLSRDSIDGLRFYYFDSIQSDVAFKNQYRHALDGLELSSEQVERLVAEANVAFVLNMRIFEELDVLGCVDGALVRSYTDATRYYDDCLRNQEERGIMDDQEEDYEEMEEEEGKCPFGFVGGPNPHGNDVVLSNTTTTDGSKGGASGNSIPDGSTSSTNKESKTKEHKESSGERCPWPFIFFHDPATGMRDYQTWIVIGLVLCWLWSYVQCWLVNRVDNVLDVVEDSIMENVHAIHDSDNVDTDKEWDYIAMMY